MIMEGSHAYLAPDIIHNILKRLPVKSLIRFQCVCKGWKNILNDPFFIAEHLEKSSHQPSLIFRQQLEDDKPLNLLSLDSNILQIHEIDHTPFIHCLSRLKDPFIWDITIVGSINGLLCVRLWRLLISPILLLWNPAIKEIIEVSRTNDGLTGGWSTGFGFSAIANDYKIVTIHSHKCYHDGNGNLHWVVNGAQVYSLSTGSWKDIEFSTIEGVNLRPSRTSVSNNGAIIWVGENHGNMREEVLISFDIETEMFTLIPMPPSHCSSFYIPTMYDKRPVSIPTTYDNKLALLQYHPKCKSCRSSIYLWVIENTCPDGGRWSWIKKYGGEPNIVHPYYLLTPMNIWRNEIVCRFEKVYGYDELGGCGKTLCLLNPNSNEVKMFVTNPSLYFCGVLNYVKSLVPIRT